MLTLRILVYIFCVCTSSPCLNYELMCALGINVPRRRFLPVKTTSDLLIIMSNLYSLKTGFLDMNPQRSFPSVPLVKLGTSFVKVLPNQSPVHYLRLFWTWSLWFVWLTLRTSEAGIPTLRKLPYGVRSRYTCGTVCQSQAPEVDVPTLFSNAYRHRNARVIEIQTRQQLKNNFFLET